MARLLDEEYSADDQAAAQAGTPTDWANESSALTIEYVYPLPESNAGQPVFFVYSIRHIVCSLAKTFGHLSDRAKKTVIK